MLIRVARPASGYAMHPPLRRLTNDLDASVKITRARGAASGWASLGKQTRRHDSKEEAMRRASTPALVGEAVATNGTQTVFRIEEEVFEVAPREIDESMRIVAVSDLPIHKAAVATPASIAARLASSLRKVDREWFEPRLRRYIEKLDVDWKKLSRRDVARALRSAEKELLRAGAKPVAQRWRSTTTIELKRIGRWTKRTLHDNFFPSLGLALSQAETKAVENVARLPSLFLRDEFGRRSERLTREARDVVTRGLRAGLGKDQIAEDIMRRSRATWSRASKNYARTVASAAVSRARSFVEVKSYVSAGVESMEVQAIFDHRTTDVCRALDGTIISSHVADQQVDSVMNMTAPQQVYKVSPFLSTRRDASGTKGIYSGNTKLGEVVRSGVGRADDRGQYKMFRAGDKLAREGNIGPPPYHHLCRSITVPRTEVVSVPRNFHVAATGIPPRPPRPARIPAGAATFFREHVSRIRPPRPRRIVQRRDPTRRKPVVVGDPSRLDTNPIPPTFLDNATPRNAARRIAAKTTRAAAREWTASKETFQRGKWRSVGTPKRPADLADDLSLRGEQSLLEIHGPAETTDLAAALASPSLKNKEVILKWVDGGRARYFRIANRPESLALKVRRALSKPGAAESKKLFEKFLDPQKQKGWLRVGDKIDDVAAAPHERVPAGTKASPKPKPSKAATPARPDMNEVKVRPEVYDQRPSKAQVRRAARKEIVGNEEFPAESVLFRRTKVASDGRLVEHSSWAEFRDPKGAISAFENNVALSKNDAVAHLFVGDLSKSRLARTVRSIAKAERRLGHNTIRDWVLTDARGNTYFVRVDGRKVTDEFFKRLDEIQFRGVYGLEERYRRMIGDLNGMEGLRVEEDVRKLWKKAVVDWNKPGLIKGVPIEEQARRRVSAMKKEIDDRVAARKRDAARRGESYHEATGAELKKMRDEIEEGAKSLPWRGAGHVDFQIADMIGDQGGIALLKKEADRLLKVVSRPTSKRLREALALLDPPKFARGVDRAFYHPDLSYNDHRRVIFLGDPQVSGALKRLSPGKTAHHEFQHLVDTVGRNDEAVRAIRNSKIKGGRLNKVAKKGEFGAPGFTVSYDGKIYDVEPAVLKQSFEANKKFSAKKLRKMIEEGAASKNAQAEIGSEYGAQAASRLFTKDGPLTNRQLSVDYELDPEQFAIFFAVRRGHFVP